MVERDTARDVYRQALPIMLVSLIAGLFAGTILGSDAMREGIERVPGILLLLPAFLATRGGVYGSLGARLSSALHQGLIEPRIEWNDRLVKAIVASVSTGVTVSVFIAAIGYAVLRWLGRSGDLLQLVGIMVVATCLSATVMLTVLIPVVFASYRRGLDPDNLVGPIVTTLGDIFGIAFLLVGIAVVGLVL